PAEGRALALGDDQPDVEVGPPRLDLLLAVRRQRPGTVGERRAQRRPAVLVAPPEQRPRHTQQPDPGVAQGPGLVLFLLAPGPAQQDDVPARLGGRTGLLLHA